MDSNEYRRHARNCRRAAERSTEPIRGDFLAAADIWDMLARQFDFLTASSAHRMPYHDGEPALPRRAHRR
jgi:hypothetical protein